MTSRTYRDLTSWAAPVSSARGVAALAAAVDHDQQTRRAGRACAWSHHRPVCAGHGRHLRLPQGRPGARRDGGPGPMRGAHVGRLRREFGAVPKQKLVAGVQEAAAVLHGLAERARHHDWGQVPAGRQPQARLSFVLGNREAALPSQPPTDGAAEPRSTRIRQMSVASPREKAETRSAKSTGSPAITGFLDHTEPPA